MTREGLPHSMVTGDTVIICSQHYCYIYRLASHSAGRMASDAEGHNPQCSRTLGTKDKMQQPVYSLAGLCFLLFRRLLKLAIRSVI